MKLSSFFYGIKVPFIALSLILRSPKLFLLSLLPIAISIFLYVSFFVHLNSEIISRWDQSNLGINIASILLKIGLVFISIFTFSFTTNLIAIPFNDFLAEATERIVGLNTLPEPRPTRLNQILIDIGKSLFGTAIAALAVFISFIPVINIAAIVTLWLTLAFQFLTYPQTRRGSRLKIDVQFILKHAPACLGFGFTLALLFAIPLISFLIMPLAVVGGTILFARITINLK